jgi:acetyl esterase
VYFHGGGWVLNFLDIYDASLARLANQSGATIISVNYQKAPEHPFPIPFDDCYATLLWVLQNGAELNIDTSKLGVAGDSAGANLAAAVALKARDNAIDIAFQLLIYPCNDRDFDTESYRTNASGYGLSTQAMQWFWQQYLQGDAHNQNPYAIPMRAENFSNLAPAIVITAEYDPLLSDGEKYVELLARDGVATSYKRYEGMIHGFFTNMAVTPAAEEAIDFSASEIVRLTP